MCTISWEFFPWNCSQGSKVGVDQNTQVLSSRFQQPQFGYRVYFNRDEQKIRAVADVPKLIEIDSVKIISPRDPQGGGTWCAVNQYGFTVALLNYYQGRLPKGKLRSRGEIVRNSAQYRSVDDIEKFLSELDLQKYPPFSLLVFSPFSNVVAMMRWTGKMLENSVQMSPLISSAKYFELVNESRSELFSSRLSVDKTLEKEDYIAIHKSHIPEKSAYSMCMHREDAQTVSFSLVEVSNSEIAYWYTNGAPCEAPLEKFASISKVKCN